MRSSPVKTQFSETPLSSMAQGSPIDTTSVLASPHSTVRACSFSTARASGRSGSGPDVVGRLGAIHSNMIIAMASADAAGASQAGGHAQRRAGGVSARTSDARSAADAGWRGSRSLSARPMSASSPYGSPLTPAIASAPRLLSVVLEVRPHPFLGAEDPRLHRAHRAVHDPRDVFQRQPFDLGEQQRRLELLRQPDQRAFQVHVDAGALAVLAGRVVKHRRVA